MDPDKSLVTHPSIIANIFNNHLSTIGSKIEKKFLIHREISETILIKKIRMVIYYTHKGFFSLHTMSVFIVFSLQGKYDVLIYSTQYTAM